MEMRKFNLILLLLLIPSIVQAAAPTRAYNYVAHTTIDPSQNNTNENALYTYLQSGVDTYSAGSIMNVDVSSSAAIAYSKLNLIGSITNADISASAGIVGSKLDLTSPGAIGSVSANTGAFTTLKVGVTNQGDILYDNGTSFVRLVPGTAGNVLTTQGASANPVWSVAKSVEVFTSSGTFTAPSSITKVYLTMCGGGGGGGGGNTGTSSGGGGAAGKGVYNYPYTVVGGNNYTVTINSGGGGGIPGADGTVGGSVVFDALTMTGGAGGKGTGATPYAGGSNVLSLNGTAGGDGGSIGFAGTGGAGVTGGSGRGGGGGASIIKDGGNGGTGAAGAGGSPGVNTCAGGGGGAGGAVTQGDGGNGGSGVVYIMY